MTNYDSIHIDAGATLALADTVTLQGGGTVMLQDTGDSSATIAGPAPDSGSPAELDNVDNTISGAGTIGAGNGQLTLINEAGGTIDADIGGGALTLGSRVPPLTMRACSRPAMAAASTFRTARSTIPVVRPRGPAQGY